MTLFRRNARPLLSCLPMLPMLPMLLAPAVPAQAQDGGMDLPSGASQTSPLRTAPDVGPALNRVLPVDQAFMLGAVADADNTLLLAWEIRDGYYLYRKSLSVEAAGANDVLGDLAPPPGQSIEDPYFGEVEVYYEQVRMSVPYRRPEDGELTLRVRYQGCAEAGYCYPMQERTISLTLPD